MNRRLVLISGAWAILARPRLWREALGALRSISMRGRPWPSSAYLGWRLETAYGPQNPEHPGRDLIHYLEWRRQMRRSRAGRT